MVRAVQHLPSMYEALSLIPSTEKKKKYYVACELSCLNMAVIKKILNVKRIQRVYTIT
jgi:hypothetical protein